MSANLLASDIAVLPYRDGVSFRRGSLMAALAHGLPVVSTEPAVPLPELRPDENMVLTPVQSPTGLAEGVAAVWHNPAVRRRLSRGAAELANLFTWESIARRHTEIYDDLV